MRTCHLLPPYATSQSRKVANSGNSNEVGSPGQDAECGHLAMYDSRDPNHLPWQPPEDGLSPENRQNSATAARMPLTHIPSELP
jgi:hypothetical protein